jgi:hypothetical protein
MQTIRSILAVGFVLILGSSTAALADLTCDSDLECEDNAFSVKIGGEGSMSSEDIDDPGQLSDGEIATAQLDFSYDGVGTLTITVTNTTCSDTDGAENSTLQSIYFNTVTSTLSNLQVAPTGTVTGTWSLCTTEMADGFGTFDYRITTATCNTSGSNEGIRSEEVAMACVDSSATFTLDVSPTTVNACDFQDSSNPPENERAAQFATKFQDATQGGSGFLAPCSEGGLLVELRSFDATPSDGAVRIDWETALELDNQGFYIWRVDLANHTAERVSGFLPALAANGEGAQYSFTDRNAVNGVEYTYYLEDIDLFAFSTVHPAKRAVPNPQGASVTLLGPDYGTTQSGAEKLTVAFSAVGSGFDVEFNTDPSFQTAATGLSVRSGRDGNVTLNPSQMRRLNEIAASGPDGLVYWRVVDRKSSDDRASQVWRIQIAN